MRREHGQLEAVRLAAELSQISSYSASVSPSSRCAAPRRHGAHAAAGEPAADSNSRPPSAEPRERVHGVLGVRHQAHHVARLVAHAGDVVGGAVRVLAVARSGTPPGRSPRAARAARAGRSSGRSCASSGSTACPRRARAGEGGVGFSTTRSTWRQTKRRLSLRQQRAGQQARLAEHLEAVADAQHRAAVGGERGDRLHDRREARDRAGPQVVAVGEAAGHHHGVDARQVVVGVPEQLGLAEAPRRPAGRPPRRSDPGNRMTPNFTGASETS